METSTDLLARSYTYCREIARRRAENFYYSFLVLPREKRDAMCAIYAFMRYCDDVADESDFDGNRADLLECWHEALEEAMESRYGESLILPAFHDTVRRYNIPRIYFHELIDGASMDISVHRYATFDQLYRYCYKVASVVGIVCIHVLGFDDDEARKYAEYCGIAFQLTNILRDAKEDALMGRIYLPREDLDAFRYTPDDLSNGVLDDRFQRLMQFEVQRARTYYNAARPLLPMIHESGRPGLQAMIEIYSAILDRIEKRNYDVFSSRVSVSGAQKLAIAAKAFLMSKAKGGQTYLPEWRV